MVTVYASLRDPESCIEIQTFIRGRPRGSARLCKPPSEAGPADGPLAVLDLGFTGIFG